jgi:pimeloyl-ACP methyl ester carboxylesterase
VGRESHPEFELKDEAVEHALRTGEHQGLLEDYFGADEYRELRDLSREVASRGVRGGPRVLILPGIMGSKLGVKRSVSILDDVYWFDPIDIAKGHLADLALSATGTSGRFTPLGVILLTYLKLKLRLRAAGYDADFYAYDWRLSLVELGRQLSQALESERGQVDLVAHSMGGLVSRAALAQGGTCRRLVMLGTPNLGSFAPVMALRGTYPLVRKVAALDLKHTPEELARDVFSTFRGLIQMLPAPSAFTGVDLYDLAQWPDDALRPPGPLLKEAHKIQEKLSPGQSHMHLIAGVEQRTVVGVRREDGQFVYDVSTVGDGTVPLELARLPGLATIHYVAEAHGSLPNHKIVARAVTDLLARGTTEALPATYTPGVRGAAVEAVPEAALRVDPYEGRRGGLLSQRELRHMLDDVAAPDARDEVPGAVAQAAVLGAPAGPGYVHPFDRVVVGRRRQHRVDLRFALGSITEVDCRAVALGIFRGVTPNGAASALDRRLGGAITELSRRRMFSGQVGEIFIMPTGRHPIAADLVTFVGLGDFDRFNEEVLQTAAENVLRIFVNTRVEEFATVLFGGGSGEDPATALRSLLTGFLRGLKDADHDHHFRRMVICENDPDRYLRLKQELYRLSSTALCENVELTFDEVKLPAEPIAAVLPARLAAVGPAPVYLIVREEGGDAKEAEIRSSLLTAGGKATVVTGTQVVGRGVLESLRRRAAGGDGKFDKVGLELAEKVLASEVRTVLARFRQHHLVVVHDAPLSRVPWEVLALAVDGERAPWFPAAEKGLSHRYEADHLSVAKWLEERITDDVLSVLLVVNPTEDLDGAEEEGDRIRKRLHAQAGVRLDELRHGDATKPALLRAFGSGRYDVLHYAGHAQFNERARERSGIVCHGGDVLAGADLARLANLPALVFFNACESGRVRGRDTSQARLKHLSEGVGLAEAFLRGGLANFIGTYWPVGDFAAKAFADKLYAGLLAGQTLGEAVQEGRAAIRPKSPDWANYILYGSPDFTLKDLSRSG